MSSPKPLGRKRITKRVRFVDQGKLVKSHVTSHKPRSITPEHPLNHLPTCPLAKQDMYKQTYHIKGRKTSSMDRLILYYLTRLKRLYSEDEWQKALETSNDTPEVDSNHSNPDSYCSHKYNKKLKRKTSKMPLSFEQARKRSTIEELIAQSLRYGVRKGLLEKDGNCYKWKKPHSSTSTVHKSNNSCSDLCVAHVAPIRSCLRSQSAKNVSKLPRASFDSLKPRLSNLHKNPLKHISSSSLRTTSSSTLSDAPLTKKLVQKSSKRVEPRSATESENYCTSQDTLTDYKPLRNHHCKSPTFYFKKKKQPKDYDYDFKKDSFPVNHKLSRMDLKDVSNDIFDRFGVERKRPLVTTHSSTAVKKKKRVSLSPASSKDGIDSETSISPKKLNKKSILKKKKDRRKNSLKNLT